MSEKKRKRTSFELTEMTERLLIELKIARWDYTEVINAGIVVFSQLKDTQKKFFRETAYGLKANRSENARNIFRKWIIDLLEDVQGHPTTSAHSRKAKSAESG